MADTLFIHKLPPQTVCGLHRNADTIEFNQVPAEQLFWLHWMNIFTTRARRHEDVAIAVAKPRNLKNLWLAGLLTSHPPVAVAPLFPPLPPVQISKIEYLFQAALCLCAVVVEIGFCSLIIVHWPLGATLCRCAVMVKIVTAAAHPFPLLPPVNKFVESMEP